MHKSILFLALFLQGALFAQTDSLQLNNEYISEIDSALNSNILKKYFYPNMSFCGGALYGFYRDDKLVYIQSTYSGESGYRTLIAYLNNGQIIHLILEEHFPDWSAINDEYSKIINSKRVIARKENEYIIEQSFDKIQSLPDGENLMHDLINCVESMIEELNKEKTEIDMR